MASTLLNNDSYSTLTRVITDEEITKCITYIRLAPGKVYAYELIRILNRDEQDLEQLLRLLCTWKEKEYVLIDESASVSNISRLAVLCTNPLYRYELDNLLLIKNETLHSNHIVRIDHHDDQTVTVEYAYKHSNYTKKLVYRNVTMDALIQTVIAQQPINLSSDFEAYPAYVENFDYKILLAAADHNYNIFNSFNGRNAIFVETVNFDHAHFEQPVDFDNAVFYCSQLSFQSAHFHKSLSFRNARFLCHSINFSNAHIEEGILSFEDAVLDSHNVYFDKMNLGKANLYCFQTILPLCTVSFVEAKLEDSEIYFEDSTLDKLILLNVNKLPLMNLSFRQANYLSVVNCEIHGTLYLSNVNKVSFKGSKNNGCIISEWNMYGSGNGTTTIVDAVIQNGDTNKAKAEQLVMLKENFHALGQYDYEDLTFIAYMKQKRKSSPMILRAIDWLLYIIGDYGINPLKVVRAMIAVITFFGLIFTYGTYMNLLHSDNQLPNHSSLVNDLFDGFHYSIATFLAADSEVTPIHAVSIALTLCETFFGWFLLGYFSIAVIRKTLR